MESSAPTASSSLKKLKREAAQRRKAQARSLKLRADEQERLQRLEIDALVEQQRLQRLERQRCEELAAARVILQGSSSGTLVGGLGGGGGPLQQQHHHHHHQVAPSQQQSHDGKCKPSPPGGGSNNSNKSQQPLQQQHHHQQHQQDFTSRGGGPGPVAAAAAIDHATNSCMSELDPLHAEPQQQHQQPASLQKVKSGLKSDGLAGGGGGGGGGWRGKESQRNKHAHQQSMRAAVESRRRLARGPRSGSGPGGAAGGPGGGGAGAGGAGSGLGMGMGMGMGEDAHQTLHSEDHRVVSTDYQAAGTQALMRVTLLAAGFVIGARGISARLIGQVTGAIVQSWTESCRPEAVPIRLFRIQGKKAVVQAAVALIGQAVTKYKDLCDCKRRGEFVQREHIINGVEFYYQPPPRKAFAINAAASPEPPPQHHQHHQQQQQQQQQQSCRSSGASSKQLQLQGDVAIGPGTGDSPGGGNAGDGDGSSLGSAASAAGHGHGSLGFMGGQLQSGGAGGRSGVVGTAGGKQSGGGAANVAARPELAFTPHHVWLQHLHQQKQQQQQAAQEMQSVKTAGGITMAESRSGRSQSSFFDWRWQQQQQQQQQLQQQQQQQVMLVGNSSQGHHILQGSALSSCGGRGGGGADGIGGQDVQLQQQQQQKDASGDLSGATDAAGVVVVDSRCSSTSELERIAIDQGLQQSVASLEHALHQVRLEQQLLQHNRTVTEIVPSGGGLSGGRRGSTSGGGESSNARASFIPAGTNLTQQHQQQQLQVNVGNERVVPDLWGESGVGVGSGAGGSGGHVERVAPGYQLGSSLFSIFGSGELPMPISTSSSHDHGRSSTPGANLVVDGSPAAGPVQIADAKQSQQQQQHQHHLNSSIMTSSSTMATSGTGGPFEFPRCDFLRESLHAFSFAPPVPSRDNNNNSSCSSTTSKNSCVNGSVSDFEYSLYGHSKSVVVGDFTGTGGPDSSASLCIVCLEQPAGVRLLACGHASFCWACVQGLVSCPLCREKIVGLHQCPSSRPSSSPAASAGVQQQQQQQRSGPPAVGAKLSNGSSYHLWNWVPGASV